MSSPSDLHNPTPKSVAAYVRRNAARVKKTLAGMGHHGPAVSVRETDHKGHHIVVRTTYEILVDGHPVMGHFLVTDEGQVQCHALPNYTFLSALDLVKALIDQFPEDFDHSAHGGHSMPGMPSMRMRKSASRPRPRGGGHAAPARKKKAANKRPKGAAAGTKPRKRK